jgi:hypothetical protein
MPEGWLNLPPSHKEDYKLDVYEETRTEDAEEHLYTLARGEILSAATRDSSAFNSLRQLLPKPRLSA